MSKNIKFWVSIIFELFIFIIGFIGVGILVGLFNGKFNLNMFNYYTILSNVLCLIYIFLKIILKVKNVNNKDYQFMKNFRGSIVLGIIITGLVYHFLLSGGSFNMTDSFSSSFDFANLVVHYILPLSMVIDWLIFDIKGYYNKFDPIKWEIIPILYLIYSMICGGLKIHKFQDSYYPYFFIDIDKLGIFSFLGYVIGLILIFLILGYVLYFIDRKLSNIKNK